MKKKILILSSLVFLLALLFVFLGLRKETVTLPPSFPTPTPVKVVFPPRKGITNISPLQKTIVGETTTDAVEKLPNLEKKETFLAGETQYSFVSFFATRPNQILMKNNRAIFERIIIPENPNEIGHVKISQLTSSFGKPEKIIQGSLFYGPFSSTYIYSNRGFAFVGNAYSDWVHEIHLFSPMNSETYIKTFGEDIKEGPPEPERLYE